MNAQRGLLLAAMVLLSSAVNAEPFAFAVNTDDETNADSLLRVDLATGQIQIIGALPLFLEDVEGLAFDNDGNLFAVDSASKSLARVDLQTGDATPVANRRANLGFRPTQVLDFGMTFACDGTLLLVAEQTQSLYEVNPNSGQALVIGQSGGLGDAMTAVASYGASTYALASDSGNLYRVDAGAGTAEVVMTLSNHKVGDAGMAFDPQGFLWVVLDGLNLDSDGHVMFDPSTILRINISTREVVEIAQTRTGIESLAIGGPGSCSILGTPGPASAVPGLDRWGLLLLAALLALLAWRRLPARD